MTILYFLESNVYGRSYWSYETLCPVCLSCTCIYFSDNVGFDYRLAGGKSKSNGRVEIGYSGRWGMVCAWSWQSADARVLCRSLGYIDGIVEYTVNK